MQPPPHSSPTPFVQPGLLGRGQADDSGGRGGVGTCSKKKRKGTQILSDPLFYSYI